MRRLLWALLIPAFGLTQSAYALSIKNFREILAFYGNATGVDPQSVPIQQVYATVKTRLPLHGTVTELISPAVLGATELAGAFCSQLIANDSTQPAANRRAHQAIVFTAIPSALTDDMLTTTVNNYAQIFWERAATGSEVETFKASWTNLRTISAASTTGTRQVLQVLCTQAATSMDSLIFY